jgi:hypothetical protein
MCAVVRLRSLMARQAGRIITNPPIVTVPRSCAHMSFFDQENHFTMSILFPVSKGNRKIFSFVHLASLLQLLSIVAKQAVDKGGNRARAGWKKPVFQPR